MIFDAALGASSLSWSLVQPAVARITPCMHLRPGRLRVERGGPLPATADASPTSCTNCCAARPSIHPTSSSGTRSVARHAALRRRHRKHRRSRSSNRAIPESGAPATSTLLIARGGAVCDYGASRETRPALAVSVLVGFGALGPARALVAMISRGTLRREDEGILAPIWKLPPEARRVLPTPDAAQIASRRSAARSALSATAPRSPARSAR